MMSLVAKTGDARSTAATSPRSRSPRPSLLVVICGLFAAIGAGAEMQALRAGLHRVPVHPGGAARRHDRPLLLGALCLRHADLPRPARVHLGGPGQPLRERALRCGRVLRPRLALRGRACRRRRPSSAAGIVLLAIAALSYPQLRALVGLATRCRRAAWSSSSARATRVARRSRRRSCEPSWRAGQAAPRASSRPAPASGALPGRADGARGGRGARESSAFDVHPHGSQPLTRELCARASRDLLHDERAA